MAGDDIENARIAQTILAQLGGHRFTVMTGAKHYLRGQKSLSFQIPKSNGIRGVRIKLEANDTYRVEFLEISGSSANLKVTYEDVHEDNLQEIFTIATGLRTQL